MGNFYEIHIFKNQKLKKNNVFPNIPHVHPEKEIRSSRLNNGLVAAALCVAVHVCVCGITLDKQAVHAD